ncbi:unnamed protein product, partial [Mesorhabditis belari]|uniref:DH domain-containing protein n=1 Tax=Mesorhabditis belari TaxID=2138241 RepID=A0AAF3FGA2_9BILA
MDREVSVRADVIEHVLRDGIALLPGCRDRQGHPLVVFPSREPAVNPDHVRNILLYLREVCADDARDRGFMIVIDMRGKQTWNNVKPMLKAINCLVDGGAAIAGVFIINPDKLGEKLKTQISSGFCKFEVQKISVDTLNKYFESTQLIRELGGSFYYDHDEWLETRLELERWIGSIIEEMRRLELHRRQICEAESPVDVPTAQAAIEKHTTSVKRAILNVPIDIIQQKAQIVQERVLRNGRPPNPDLEAALPNLANLVASLQQLKNEVYKLWENRRIELQTTVELKLFERDADQLLSWLREMSVSLQRAMGDVGTNETEAREKWRQFEEIVLSVETREDRRQNIAALAGRICATIGPMKNRVEMAAARVNNEWENLKELVNKRRDLIKMAIGFYKAAQSYSIELPNWVQTPGVDPATIDGNSNEQIEEAIASHERFWNRAEGVYAEVADLSSHLFKAQRNANVSDLALGAGIPKEHFISIQREHKRLADAWKARKIHFHRMLALIAFQKDIQLVVEWLEQHGEPYLDKTMAVGDNYETAKQQWDNHLRFQQIAQNTYTNAEKLFEASRELINSGIVDAQRTQLLVVELSVRIDRFKARVEERLQLLKISYLFHTHYMEITKWYGEMEQKYADRAIDSDVEQCESNKKNWLLESDGTAQAYATTISEGKKLVGALQRYGQERGIDYANSVNAVNRLMGEIDQRNSRITEHWQSRRFLLQAAVKFANFVTDGKDILSQIGNWELDMREMVNSATFVQNAEKVQPLHRENTIQVKRAVRSIRLSAQELIQALQSQPELRDLHTRSGERVLETVNQLVHALDESENRVMQLANQTMERIDAARKYNGISSLAYEMTQNFEKEMDKFSLAPVPSTLDETVLMSEENEQLRHKIERENARAAQIFSQCSEELIRTRAIDRNLVVALNENVMSSWRALLAASEERNKLLKAAGSCFKTYFHVGPILDQLEGDYDSSPELDLCMAWIGECGSVRAAKVAELITKHTEHKEKFLKGCGYAQNTSNLFLRYVSRLQESLREMMQTLKRHEETINNNTENYREKQAKIFEMLRMLSRHEEAINTNKENLRERQSKILELWNGKKKQLDRCQRYVLTDAARQEIVDWITGEGEAGLIRFTRHARAKLTEGDRGTILDDFKGFKFTVKSKRNEIKTIIQLANETINSDESTTQHVDDLKRCIKEVEQRYEDFIRRINICEDALRNDGRVSSRDELSLDRHSDSNVEETLKAKKEIDGKVREPMRELLKSERDYVDDLDRCCKIYLAEYDAASTSNSLPAALRGRRYEVFGNIEKVLTFHAQSFLPDVSKYEDDPEQVGCCFTVYVDLINELYTEYCVNKEQNNHVLDMPETRLFFKAVQDRHRLDIKDDLGSLLIKPIQRITRYRLMLEQLMKHCTGNIEEFKDAHEIVVGVPRRANDLIHLNCLEKKDSLSHVGPFVMQDTLTRDRFSSSSWRSLSQKRLRIPDKAERNAGKSVRYFVKGKPIQLNEVTIVEHVDVNDSTRFGLRLGVSTSNDNRYDLRASSDSLKNTWVRRIRELTQGLYKPLFNGDGFESAQSLSLGTRSTSRGSSDHRNSRDAESIASSSGAGNLSEHRLSLQDTESVGSASQRFSMQSTSSNEEKEQNGNDGSSKETADPMETRKHKAQIRILSSISSNSTQEPKPIQQNGSTQSNEPPDLKDLKIIS